MTREENIEEVAFYLECLMFYRQMARKYHGTAVGIASKEIQVSLKKAISNATGYHKKTFGEKLDVALMESLV